MAERITVTEFARRQGVSRAAVHKWMQALPDLRPLRIGGLVLLSAKDCQRLLARPRKKMGRPKKVVDNAEPAA